MISPVLHEYNLLNAKAFKEAVLASLPGGWEAIFPEPGSGFYDGLQAKIYKSELPSKTYFIVELHPPGMSLIEGIKGQIAAYLERDAGNREGEK